MSTDKGTVQQQFAASIIPISRIVPAGPGMRISMALKAHADEMEEIVQKVLRE